MAKKLLKRRVLKGLEVLKTDNAATTRHYSIFSPEEMAYIESKLLSDVDLRTDHPVSSSSPRESTVTNNVVAKQEVKRDPVLSDREDLTDEEKAHLKQLERDELYGNIADNLGEFRTTLGLVTAAPWAGYIGIPITMANALIDRYWFHDPERATRELRDVAIASGLSEFPAAARAVANTKYVAPVVHFLNEKAVAPISQWWTTKVSPIMARAATTAKRLLPSWTDRTPTLTEKLAAEGQQLRNSGVQFKIDSKLYSRDSFVKRISLVKGSDGKMYLLTLFERTDPDGTTYLTGRLVEADFDKGVPVFTSVARTPETAEAFGEVELGFLDAEKYLNDPRFLDLIDRMYEEAAEAGYQYTSPIRSGGYAAEDVANKGLVNEHAYMANNNSGGESITFEDPSKKTIVAVLRAPNSEGRYRGIATEENLHGRGLAMYVRGDDLANAETQAFYNSKIAKDFGSQQEIIDSVVKLGLNKEAAEKFAPYIMKPLELAALGKTLGQNLGIENFAEYPGLDTFATMLKNADDWDSALTSGNVFLLALFREKVKNPETAKKIWLILSGNYIASVIPAAIAGGTMLMFNNNSNNYENYR